jgi:hypothetical protein
MVWLVSRSCAYGRSTARKRSRGGRFERSWRNLSMSRQDPDTLRDWFEHLLSMPLQLRQDELGRCADPVMRSKLEKMMASDSEDLADDLAIAAPQALAAAIGEPPTPAQMAAGQHIGPYEIVKFLGEGGCASVFLAQRDLDGVQQRVAVKLLHRGLHTDQARRVFRRERQALASLSHPNIAHLATVPAGPIIAPGVVRVTGINFPGRTTPPAPIGGVVPLTCRFDFSAVAAGSGVHTGTVSQTSLGNVTSNDVDTFDVTVIGPPPLPINALNVWTMALMVFLLGWQGVRAARRMSGLQ